MPALFGAELDGHPEDAEHLLNGPVTQVPRNQPVTERSHRSEGGQHIGRIDIVEIDGVKVAAKTARAWQEIKALAARDGVSLVLNSGFRTQAEQQALYQRYQSGTGNLAAYPGYSNHQHGQALDIDVARQDAYDWMHANAPALGWRRTVPSEAWHWEYFGR
jgi:LAS superfamily LD-carboxypeptidase LdcB